MHRTLQRIALLLLALALLPLGGAAETTEREIALRTTVTKWGQLPERFEIRHQALPDGLTAEDFAISGQAAGWETGALYAFTCGVKAVEAAEDGWTLWPERFPDKFFYVRALEVSCARHPELSFTLEDIGETTTATADDFALVEDRESRLTAKVFSPRQAGARPLVVVFHGYGDANNLLSCRTAVAWAEPEAQAARPCTVVAPVIINTFYTSEIARSRIYQGLMNYIDQLIEAGQVDPQRVYAMGNSFGGMAALELAELYPDRIAAVLSLCPALIYAPIVMAGLPGLTETPIFIAQAENDETIPSETGRHAAEALMEAGNPNVRLRVYTDAEMEACGASYGYEETYSFHHVELAVMEDPAYAEWLFSQRLP